MRDAIALERRVDLFSVLTSEIRHATNTGEIRHFTTLLNSRNPATVVSGSRHASIRSADV
jgi:hypothetical protein